MVAFVLPTFCCLWECSKGTSVEVMVQYLGHGVHLNFLILKKIFDVIIRSNMVAIFFLRDLGASVVEVKKWVSYTDILSYE